MRTEQSVGRKRNQAMEAFKLAASILVVFIHVQFPGMVGGVVVSLARTAVPTFFAISGFFSYQTRSDRLMKRLAHMVVLFIVAVAASAVAGSLTAACTGGDVVGYLRGFVPGTENLATMMLLQDSSFPKTAYTWYLISAGICYLVLSVYAAFWGEQKVDYRPLYLFSALLLAVNLLLAEMPRPLGGGVPYQLQRNALLTGLPMFTLGIFLREHRERIMKNFALTDGKLLGLLALGAAMTLLQWKGVGMGELPPGTVVQTVALMLLLSAHPDLGCPCAAQLGAVSTVVYLLHFPLIGIYETFVLPVLPLGSTAESWLRPVLVAAMSVAAGLLWLGIVRLVKRSVPEKK